MAADDILYEPINKRSDPPTDRMYSKEFREIVRKIQDALMKKVARRSGPC